jgi:predicted metal-dependent hydrolase
MLQVRPDTTLARRKEIMTDWYREQFHPLVAELIAKWEQKIGVKASHWGIKQMKTRWGTCNHRRGRILINLELARKPLPCVEYVIVHELLHLIEKRHNDHFAQLISTYLPKWNSLKGELNRFILSHDEWRFDDSVYRTS